MPQSTVWITILILFVNTGGLVAMGYDKKQAQRRRRRVAETRLFTIALLGGSFGILAGMYRFRHKTRHLSFRIGVPLILIIQMSLFIYFVFYN